MNINILVGLTLVVCFYGESSSYFHKNILGSATRGWRIIFLKNTTYIGNFDYFLYLNTIYIFRVRNTNWNIIYSTVQFRIEVSCRTRLNTGLGRLQNALKPFS